MAAKGHIEGERRIVTILFSDVKGSTALADQLDPEEVLEIMNGVFEMLIEPITRYEGTLARLMGDAIMAFFGAPIAHEDDPERACRAALDIIEGANRMARTLERERGISGFNVRVGINTGLVVVAEVGADLRVEYTAMGDAVNLAARMEGLAEPGTILITDGTRRSLGNTFRTEPLGPVAIKGKSEPIAVYRLLGLGESHHAPLTAQIALSPLVGRDQELRRLAQKISSLGGHSGGLCAIAGEAGLGKSRLIFEARQAESSRCLWAEGRSLAYTQSTSYGTVRQLLTALLGGRPKEPPEIIRTKLRRDLEGRSSVVLPEILPYLSLVLGLSPDADDRHRLHTLEPELLQQRMYHAFRTYLRLRASEKPIVLVWEDLQWIDPSSLGVFESLFPMLAEVPLLCLFTYRQGEERADTFSARQRKHPASLSSPRRRSVFRGDSP
jgi:class 3 adenylate cyclase